MTETTNRPATPADPRFRAVVAGVTSQRSRFRRLGQIIAAAFGLAVLGVLGVLLVTAWTDGQWYASVGQSAVFWTQYLSVAGTWLFFAVINMAVLHATTRAAWRSVGAAGRFVGLTAVLTFLASAVMAANMAGTWMTFRLAISQAPFGVADPQFGVDAGFFVFVLPAIEKLIAWAFQLVVLCLVGYLVIVMVSSRLDYTGRIEANWAAARRAFFRFGAALMVITAAWFVLGIPELDYATAQTTFTGAAFTDVHAQLPALIVMAVASLAVAAVLVLTANRTGFRLVVKAFAGLAVLAVVATIAVPYVVQRYLVRPNEQTAQLPYLSRNITFTRLAYQLDQTASQQYPGTTAPSVTNSDLQHDLADAPVWSAATVSQAFNQLQTIRPYYQLSPISTDRYSIDGRLQQVLVSAREISPSALPASGSTWVNRRLVYTHGYGLAIASASQTTAEGFPQFLVGDVPATVSKTVSDPTSLTMTQPRIYFGPDQSDWVVVNTALNEFDYPTSTTNATTRYAGGDGVPLGNVLNRLAWAIRLQSPDLLVSGYLNGDSKLLLNRNVVARAQKIAPWLTYDTPYPAIIDGRITWLMDAYTTSDHFPYSQTLPNSSPFPNGTNYVRSSVKVTVDAETGKTTFYAVGDDPIRDAWSQIFGSVISHDPIPADVAAHFRVPTKLFSAQAQVFTSYHVTNPQVFYSQEDLWRLPQDAKGKTMAAQYVLLDPSSRSSQPDLTLLQPYVLPNRDDLVGWLASDSDPSHYGRTTMYELPKSRVTLGAAQISARINQDPAIAQQLTLWNQPGNTVQFGAMLVLPTDGTTIYLQPVFLRAQNSAITEMAGVIVVDGDRISLGHTLADALSTALPTGAKTG